MNNTTNKPVTSQPSTPLDEINRIIAELEEILSACDAISESLKRLIVGSQGEQR